MYLKNRAYLFFAKRASTRQECDGFLNAGEFVFLTGEKPPLSSNLRVSHIHFSSFSFCYYGTSTSST